MNVVVALSGGVDSALSAALLVEAGHTVSGMFMKNWSPRMEQSLTDCPWERDQRDAEAVCAHLGIPFRSVNFEAPYESEVVRPLLEGYARGETPNPDVLCNERIKFDFFFREAMAMGADAIATGHYARVENGVLKRGLDRSKDQSYFLYRVSSEALHKTLFPIGGLEKSQVRQMASERNLPVASKKDSQGICFIGHLDLKKFLIDELGEKPGWVRLLPAYRDGDTLASREKRAMPIGMHPGLFTLTIGERLGSYVENSLYRVSRGEASVRPVYVVSKYQESAVAYGTDNPHDVHLSSSRIRLRDVVGRLPDWKSVVQDTPADLRIQTRYQQPPVAVREVVESPDGLVIHTSEPVRAVASGQSTVVYRGEDVVCGGIVCATD